MRQILALLSLVLILTGGVLGQLTDAQEQELNEDEGLLYAFFRGARIEDLNDRAYGCLWERHRFIREFNYTEDALTADNATLPNGTYPRWTDRMFNVTELVSDEFSMMYYNCMQASLQTYEWQDEYLKQFGEVNVTYSYPVSALQSMLAQIVYLTQLNIALQDASAAEDDLSFYFLAGRMARVIFIVKPLPVDQLEDEMDDDLNFDLLFALFPWANQKWLLGAPPDYLPAEEMSIVYIVLFMIEGFGSQTLGFSSTYWATQCGEIGWDMFETVQLEVISQYLGEEWGPLIESTTYFFRKVDPLAKSCVETGDEYLIAADNYGRAVNDPYYLLLNVLYHASYLYESSIEIKSAFDEGFGGRDSKYYQNLGRQMGKLFFYTFYDLLDFEYPDMSITYPKEFEEEELQFFP